MNSVIDIDFLVKLVINVISVLILVKCYYHHSLNRENAASFILFGIGVFMVTALLHSAEVSMGFAFGLFAVFSMLRYRTEAMGIKEMTYLFLVIAMALLSAVGQMQHYELVGLNLLLIGAAQALETGFVLPLYEEKEVEYEVIKNISPNRRQELIDDLVQRTGLNVARIDVLSINFLKDTAQLRLHCHRGSK